ncbi:pitrilysin family protein [Roseateles sp. SL47]|uniref:M16 family metallopeptidase n=1 Tax=Roseateles sp. SL47 TaxID=2995138 RepID=UPI00227113CF|nr:pitrilysin family protein [Roseateles sp. SL47]WAC73886.1 pitrilysin family protein [Roseateles sp. SL47]
MLANMLGNGLLWVARPAPGPHVAVRVVYRVGAKDDPTGRSGLTHLTLRLVAAASRYLEAGQFHRLVAQAGGTTSLELDEDFAALQTVVPAHQLERILWAEAERMSNPRLEPDNLDRARAQVQQAVRQPLMRPYGRLEPAMARNAYLSHPYQRGALGDPDQLKDLDLEAVRAFHAAGFRCDRALLVITGPYDEATLARWVQHHFGSIRPPLAAPVEFREVKEPRRSQSQTVKLSLPQAPLPAAALVWQVPRADDASTPIWQLAHALLARGRSGRLTDTLVDELAVAHRLHLWLSQRQQAGLLMAQGLAAHGQTAAPLAQALQNEVVRLADEPVSDEELDKAKALLKRDWQALEWSADPLARSLGTAWAVRGDLQAAAKDAAAWTRLEARDVQQLWRSQIVRAPVLTLLADVGAAAASGASGVVV